MEPKKTMASQSASMSKVETQKGNLDQEMQRLDANDCWFFQTNLERFIKISNPDAQQNGRYLMMVGMLAAQARRMAEVDRKAKEE